MVRKRLSERQCKRIEQMRPGKKGDPGCTAADNRLFVEAVLWIVRTGSPWRDLPAEFGLWNSVYMRFARWSRAGVWQRVFAQLSQEADLREIYLDSAIVRAHQHAASAQKKPARRRSVAPAAD
jgi:transposase